MQGGIPNAPERSSSMDGNKQLRPAEQPHLAVLMADATSLLDALTTSASQLGLVVDRVLGPQPPRVDSFPKEVVPLQGFFPELNYTLGLCHRQAEELRHRIGMLEAALG